MINNYTIKHKQCRQHQLPESFLCLDPQCRSVGLLCSNCIPGIHSHHYQQISSLEDFREHLQTLIRREKLNHERSSIINVAGLVKAKKQELQQKQLQLLETIMSRLTQEKRVHFEMLDLLEKAYIAKEALFKKNLEQRSCLLNYLGNFAEDELLLEAKLLSCSEWGIANLKGTLNELENLSRIYSSRNAQISTEIIQRQADKRVEGSFLLTLRNFIYASQPKQPPMKFETRHKMVTRLDIRPVQNQRKNQSMEVIRQSPNSPRRHKCELS